MKKEFYVLTSQIHFGSLKTSVPCGTKISVDRETGSVDINGCVHNNVGEIDMMIRAGNIIPFVEGKTEIENKVNVSPRAKNLEKKYEVVKSDVDEMPDEIDIPGKDDIADDEIHSDSGKMEIIREDSDSVSERGLSVIFNEKEHSAEMPADTDREILRVVNGDDFETVAKIPEKSKKNGHQLSLAPSGDGDITDAVNGSQGTVVKSIGKGKADTKSVSSGKSLVAKHTDSKSAEKAAAVAEERKKDALAKREAMALENDVKSSAEKPRKRNAAKSSSKSKKKTPAKTKSVK